MIARANKYHAKRTVADGVTFASQAEAKRYLELRWLAKAGEITHLELQRAFSLEIRGVRVCRYVADFCYVDTRTQRFVVEDVKGVKTPVYRLKKKLMQALHHIDVQEV